MDEQLEALIGFHLLKKKKKKKKIAEYEYDFHLLKL